MANVREMFRPSATRRATASITSELPRTDRLTRDECVDLARGAGMSVLAPVFSSWTRDETDEQLQILEAQESFTRRRALAEQEEKRP